MEKVRQALHQIVAEYGVDITPTVSRPEAQFGDASSNVALQLAGALGRSPRDIATNIATKLEATADFKKVDVAGPGFINVWFSDEALIDQLSQPLSLTHREQKVVIETNNPNPFKAMHIGHAFNAIIADTIANLLDLSGAEVHRVSYHGDVGAHVGKSMYSLLRYTDGDVTRLMDIPEAERNSFMSRMYAEGSAAYKEDEAAKLEIDELARQSFTRDDEQYRQIYEMCKGWSFEQIDGLVARLGNRPIEKRYLESEADKKGVPIVQQHVPAVFTQSNGAIIFEGSKYGSFDNAFVTSRGLGLYGARDIGLMTLKHDDYHADKSYIVTAEEQRDYFNGVIKAAELCLPELRGVTTNIPHGTVKLSTGKMSSRSGDVLEVAWLFDQMTAAVQARGGEVLESVIAGALRYQFLKVRVGSDLIFDVNESVSIQGNSGPYLQYAHARACSILAKVDEVDRSQSITDLNVEERTLVSKLIEYQEVVARSVEELTPHHVCLYLYELSQEFNRFYEKNRVIGSNEQSKRLQLVSLYRETLAKGLSILGIDAPERL